MWKEGTASQVVWVEKGCRTDVDKEGRPQETKLGKSQRATPELRGRVAQLKRKEVKPWTCGQESYLGRGQPSWREEE